MNHKFYKYIILNAFFSVTSTVSLPLMAQQIIDDGENVIIPGDYSSPWDLDTGLSVGHSGKGTLTITDGGVVTNVTGIIGEQTGSDGSVTVTGSGSKWLNSLPLLVGQSGNGELNINDGGLVSAAEVFVGMYDGAVGTVNVGRNSVLQSDSNLQVGAGGKGVLNITGGGQVSARIGFVGAESGSSGSVQVDGSGSQLKIEDPQGDDDLIVGLGGNGSLTVSNGGQVSNLNGYMGLSSGSDGRAVITGPGSAWKNKSELVVGGEGHGHLIVADGGLVTNVRGIIGEHAGSDGSVTVTGSGSKWLNSLPLHVGQSGNGLLNINDGGLVSAAEVFVGMYDGAVGTVNVGRNSVLQSDSNLQVGAGGKGALNITGGGQVSARIGFVGAESGSSGSVQVDGSGSQLKIEDPQGDDDLIVGLGGNGSLTVSNGGQVTAGKVYLAYNEDSAGILNIGSSEDENPVAPGKLVAKTIEFGKGTGSIFFNHNASDYIFDAGINDGADNMINSGTGLVGNGVVHAVAGRTIFNAGHGDFTGTLRASDSGILQVNGNMSAVSADILSGGRLEGRGVIGNTINAGSVAPGTSIGTLTIAGNYTGNNGVLEIETILGDDTSLTDKLNVIGDVSGSTTVKVINSGGKGSQTGNGIKIIDISGESPSDSFTLSGDYKTEDGQQAVIGGAYSYTLQHGGTNTTGDKNWYLVSNTAGGARYHPGVALYEQYIPTLAAINTLPALQQRVGNSYWTQSLNNDSAGQGGWGRIEGMRISVKPSGSDSHAQRDTDVWKLQTGVDYMQKETTAGLFIGGVNFVHGSASSSVSSPYGNGKIDTTGTGVGTTLTWYGHNSLYTDVQAQIMWFNSDISSSTIGHKLINGNNGTGYALSGETGKHYQINESFTLTPQTQLIWSKIRFSSFTDPFGTKVTSEDGDSLRMRAGLSLDHKRSWNAADGKESKLHFFTMANLYNEFLDGTKVSVSDISFRTHNDRQWAGVGIGGDYEWNNGRYAAYGSADVSNSLGHMNGNYTFGGTLGVRINW
ncbi:autotransporter outer membrane beta-barrel domain-containing protein [Morganella morganii]|nr:autotransporter outer membrane beta-barrel domain-containing protein [Morganella morganii]